MGRDRGGSCFRLSFLLFHLFCEAQIGGGGFLRITAGSDVSLGIDSWLDVIWLLLVALMGLGYGWRLMCVDCYLTILSPYLTIKYKNKSFFNMSDNILRVI